MNIIVSDLTDLLMLNDQNKLNRLYNVELVCVLVMRLVPTVEHCFKYFII